MRAVSDLNKKWGFYHVFATYEGLKSYSSVNLNCKPPKEKQGFRSTQYNMLHVTFFQALALYDLTCEESLEDVSEKYGISRGQLQSLQISASQYAGMITSFCERLNWFHLSNLLSNFQTQIESGVSRELLDLVRCHFLSAKRYKNCLNVGLFSRLFETTKLKTIFFFERSQRRYSIDNPIIVCTVVFV